MVGFMGNKQLKHAKARQGESNTIWKRVLERLQPVHHPEITQEQMFMKMHEIHIKRTVFHHRLTIQQRFILMLRMARESNQRSFSNQTLNPDFFLNNQ